jgi:hypothetical protein
MWDIGSLAHLARASAFLKMCDRQRAVPATETRLSNLKAAPRAQSKGLNAI